MSKSLIITGWPSTKDKLHTYLKPYWSYRDELAVIDGVALKGRCIVIPTCLKQQVLDQLHLNHMGIEKTKLLAHESVYWPNINVDIQKFIKSCATCLEFQQLQPMEKIIHNDTCHFNNKNYLCIVDYHSKFPVVKGLEGLSAVNQITTIKIIFGNIAYL